MSYKSRDLTIIFFYDKIFMKMLRKDAKISIIIPTHNSEKSIGICLGSIYNSTCLPHEVIIADDCSSDRTIDTVKKFYCIILPNTNRRFQAACRNIGAERASGNMLLFIDSDIELKRDSIERALIIMEKENPSAVVGIYDKFNPYYNTVSQYKNLYMHFNQLSSKKWIKWTNTSFLLISRDAFFCTEGFDESLRESICEDLDFGARFTKRGFTIFLDKNIELIHHRYLNILSFLKMEYKRARNITLINIQNLCSGNITEWPARFSFRISFLLIPLFYGSLIRTVNVLYTKQAFVLPVVLLGLFLLINSRFIRFLYTTRGTIFSLYAIPILVLGMTVSFIGTIVEIFNFIIHRILSIKNL